MKFEEVAKTWKWKEIENCPGRFVLEDFKEKESLKNKTPLEILKNQDGKEFKFKSVNCKDELLIVLLEDEGAILSYQRKNGDYCHTLNTPSGLKRKMKQLEINFETQL
jgi:hypothetical protein